ncbi:Smr/MutS family protein [Algoriphagus namhaensis]|uniref:Smr/MutS family protein n=1 Tax=Algoriphagus namhaensis TaxID=915353 RepID=A0ABV8ATS9_9BACT
MNIGDRVRMLHGNEEGVIRKISGNRVEVEIEDGFQIPAMKNEVVLISQAEEKHFQTRPKEDPAVSYEPTGSHSKPSSLSLAFIPINDQQLSVYLINGSKRSFLVMISGIHGPNKQTLFADRIAAGTHQKFDNRMLQDMDQWPAFHVQAIPIHERLEKAAPAFEKTIKIKGTQFFKHSAKVPMLNKDGYLFRLQDDHQELDIRSLNAELETIKPKQEALKIIKPSASIDLHIEKLVAQPEGMSNSEMLKIQLSEFEKNLDQAIASGMDQITFIHGIGNGVLRKEIHKRLSQMKNINYFQDTQKDRWGYGATLVRIS